MLGTMVLRPSSDRARLRRLPGSLADARGYTSTELIVVMAILGTIVASLATIFVSASKAEVDMNLRFQAQQEARLALDQLRREGHCAMLVEPAVAASYPRSLVTFTFEPYCRTGATADYTVTWCTSGSGSRWALRRIEGTVGPGACLGGTVVADHLTNGNVFSAYTANSPTKRATLGVLFVVDVDPSNSFRIYRLEDDIVLRNTLRS